MRYRAKSEVLEALQFNCGPWMSAWPEWFQRQILKGNAVFDEDGCTLTTTDSIVSVSEGDWIIRKKGGELFVIGDEAFRATYEVV